MSDGPALPPPPHAARPRSGPSDTDPRAEARLIAAYRAMSPAEKIQRVLECIAAAERMALAGLRARHPGATAAELRRRLAALRLGEPLMREAFGPDWLRETDGG